MSATILTLSDPNADLATVGGKGMSLARLLRAGMPVPGGFHVTTAAYRAFVAANDLQPRILEAMGNGDVAIVNAANPATLETASQQIRALFTAAPIPAEIANAIIAAYQAINQQSTIQNQQFVAVRSSATAEDLPEASFAGQQDTYLNIRGPEAVLDAVRRCWASLWTARAIGYRARQGIDPDSVALAVVVQELVAADAAGILFTANPLNGRRSEAVINAAWGLGEAIVGGMVTPDTLTVEKATGRLLDRQTADKQVMTVRTESGTEEQPVPVEKRQQPVLSDAQAAELAKLGAQIEQQYGMPMDIEWAWVNFPHPQPLPHGGMGVPPSPFGRGAGGEGDFYILQARPITALPAPAIEWLPPDPKGIYMRGSVVDLMPDPLSPLFVTLAIPALRTQMQPMGKRMLNSTPFLTPDYFTTINQYAYMNASMPPKMIWWVISGMLPAYPSLLRRLVPMWRDELHPEYQALVAEKQTLDPAHLSEADLWREAQALVDTAMSYILGLQFATMGASAGSEMLLTKLYDKWARRAGDPPATALLMGWDNIPVRAEKSLYDLAQWVQTQPGLADYILATPSAELLAPNSLTPPNFASFITRFQAHVAQFGHIIFQLDFAEPLPRDNPAPMLENIKMYLRGEGANPHERQQASQAKRIQTAETMRSRLKSVKGWGFRKALNWAQSLSEIREDALAEIGLAYPLLRALLLELGCRFVAAGAIDQPEDIFWLEKGEIEQLVGGGQDDHTSLQSKIVERKALHAHLKTITPPPMMPVKERIMGIKVDSFVAHAADAHTGSVLKGVPASPGRVTAPARVLHGSADFGQMRPGEVLVAGTTTPAWTPLFAMAAAVVTDIGGPLSHGSIVAREYGIPAVMGTGVATQRICNGDLITVDGSTGKVILAGADDLAAAPSEWVLPNPKYIYARASLAEHTPSPATPLFATLGLEIANQATDRLWVEMFHGERIKSELYNDHMYQVMNGYVYCGFGIKLSDFGLLLKLSSSQVGSMFRNGVPRWQAARRQLADVVAQWEGRELAALSPVELLEGVRTVFGEACRYFTVLQTTLPVATTSELIFTRFYNGLVKRKDDPAATTFLLGLDTTPLQAEKSLYDLVVWARQQPGLADFLLTTPTEELTSALTPAPQTPTSFPEFTSRLAAYLRQYGRTAYEFDFAHPTAAETPGAFFDVIKTLLTGASNPYERQDAARQRCEEATQRIRQRIGWPRKGWFEKLLRWAQENGPLRENTIFDLGMGHLLIRRMLGELGQRFVVGGALEAADDIYWLEKDEVTELVARLEGDETLHPLAERVPARQALWRAQQKLTPPTMLPEKSRWAKFTHGGQVESKDGKKMLKGIGTSSGTVTAPACVLLSPEDFPRMKPGDVLVAVTTTPAWTPLFAQAAAVVTDIGGPLSHSSIVAREYGIPAVMATRIATRTIPNGQRITVDGSAGTVTLG